MARNAISPATSPYRNRWLNSMQSKIWMASMQQTCCAWRSPWQSRARPAATRAAKCSASRSMKACTQEARHDAAELLEELRLGGVPADQLVQHPIVAKALLMTATSTVGAGPPDALLCVP